MSPLDKIPDHIKQQQNVVEKLKDEIEKAGAISEQKNVDIQINQECKVLEEELQKYGFSMDFPRKLVCTKYNGKRFSCFMTTL
jgi:hypothetical protein